MSRNVAPDCTLDVRCEEGVFEYRGRRDDGSAIYHFKNNPGYSEKPPRRFRGLLYRKDRDAAA